MLEYEPTAKPPICVLYKTEYEATFLPFSYYFQTQLNASMMSVFMENVLFYGISQVMKKINTTLSQFRYVLSRKFSK